MAFVLNKKKIERIKRGGVISDCPLFVGIDKAVYLPSWIWCANEIKREVLDLMCHHFNRQLVQLIKIFIQFGGETTDNQAAEKLNWHPSTVSARRSTLIKLGIIDTDPRAVETGPYGAPNKVWHLNFDRLYDFFVNHGGFSF
jgi:hypothetical protein